jgi:hypothetical protein
MSKDSPCPRLTRLLTVPSLHRRHSVQRNQDALIRQRRHRRRQLAHRVSRRACAVTAPLGGVTTPRRRPRWARHSRHDGQRQHARRRELLMSACACPTSKPPNCARRHRFGNVIEPVNTALMLYAVALPRPARRPICRRGLASRNKSINRLLQVSAKARPPGHTMNLAQIRNHGERIAQPKRSMNA